MSCLLLEIELKVIATGLKIFGLHVGLAFQCKVYVYILPIRILSVTVQF